MVVTSPNGLQAPPALAAITVIPTKNNRCSLLSINLRSSDTITIVVVRLSSTALKKKVSPPIIQSSLTALLVFIRSVIT